MSSWEALDFILALEWPCRDHVHHYAINPSSAHKGAETSSPSPNHALTATQTVYSCAIEPSPSQTAGKISEWHLPYSEIEKYVNRSASHHHEKAAMRFETAEPSNQREQTHRALLTVASRRRHDDARASLFDNLSRDIPNIFRRGQRQKPYHGSPESAIVAKSVLLWIWRRPASCLLL